MMINTLITAFALTFYKVQGKTLSKVVLVIGKGSGSLAHLTYTSLYVGLSRVEHGDGLRIWPLDRNDVSHLEELKPDSNIHFWDKNYKDNMWVHGGISKLTNKRVKEGMLLLESIKKMIKEV